MSAGLLQNLDRARAAAEGRVEAAGEAVVEASGKVEEERERYGEARRDLRVVEKLKEKRYDAWRETGAREDRKENDEAGAHRHTMKEGRP